MQAVADALTAHGFAAHAEGRNDQLRIINNHCPFGEVATDHPVICAVDRGMVKGMLGALVDVDGAGELGDVTTESSFARGDTFCATAVVVTWSGTADAASSTVAQPDPDRSVLAYSITRVTTSSLALAVEPLSNGGCGSYSIISWHASAAVRSTSSSTSRNAMSMPLDTPAAVMIRRSRCSTTRSLVGIAPYFGERAVACSSSVVAVRPVEQPGARRARANRCTPTW